MVQHAGHRNFEKLLRCGVRLIEYPAALLHQKIMTIDGLWCAVGSANFDDRSFETNDEITVSFIDAATAQRFDGIFERYAADGSEIELERWSRRSPIHKLVDQVYYLFNESDQQVVDSARRSDWWPVTLDAALFPACAFPPSSGRHALQRRVMVRGAAWQFVKPNGREFLAIGERRVDVQNFMRSTSPSLSRSLRIYALIGEATELCRQFSCNHCAIEVCRALLPGRPPTVRDTRLGRRRCARSEAGGARNGFGAPCCRECRVLKREEASTRPSRGRR
jgi:hypothetical protein